MSTHNIPISIKKKENYSKLSQICKYEIISKGDSNEYTQHTNFNKKKENYSKLSQICNYEIISKGDSNEYTQHTNFNKKKKITLNYPKSAAMGFFLRDSRRSL